MAKQTHFDVCTCGKHGRLAIVKDDMCLADVEVDNKVSAQLALTAAVRLRKVEPSRAEAIKKSISRSSLPKDEKGAEQDPYTADIVDLWNAARGALLCSDPTRIHDAIQFADVEG